MAYLPPLNGGRINATIGGNTAGAGLLVSSGTLTLAGGNNITLSQAGNAITISGAGGGGAGSNTFGMSNLGNTSGTTGVVSGSALQYYMAGGNNVTLSQSLNGVSGTLSISAANQTVQTQNMVSISGSTGNISFNNANNVTFGGNASAITASASFNQTAQTQSNIQAIYAGAASASTGTVTFANSNGVSFGMNGNTLTASVAAGGGGGIALAGGGTTYTSGTANLSAAGGALTIASTTGQAFNFSVPATSSLSATGAVSLSTNGSTISIGAPTQTVQTQNLYNLTLAGNSTSAGAGYAQVSSGTLTLAGGNNITLSQNGNAITISGPAAGQTPKTLSRWEYPEDVFAPLGPIGQGSLSIQHMYVPFNVTGASMKLGGSLSLASGTSTTNGSVNYSLWMGVYTLNGSTLSLSTSGSANNGFSWANTASSGFSSITGMRQMTVSASNNITPGEYWVAAVISSATTVSAPSFTLYGDNLINGAATGAVLTPIGSNTSVARDVVLFEGMYTVVTSAGPSSISGGQINNTGLSVLQSANFYNAIFNATY